MNRQPIDGQPIDVRSGGAPDGSARQITNEERAFSQAEKVGFSNDEVVLIEHALAQWIQRERRAHILIDATLRVRWMNLAAERLLSRPNSILVRNGHIRSRENRFERQLRDLIKGASAELKVCSLHDAKSGQNLLLGATSLAPPSEDLIGLTVAEVTEDFDLHLADMHAPFGLTQSETRVTQLLLSGHTAEQAALELGVSLETIRTHIKRTYVKLGVSSREAFFHKLAPFVMFAS